MFKRFIKILAVVTAVCVMLTSCSFFDNMPLLPDEAINSLAGAYTFMTNLIDQIKEEGLGSISAIFSTGDETGSSDSAASSNGDSSSQDSDGVSDETSDDQNTSSASE